MQISKSTYFVFIVVVTVMVLSITVFKGGKGSAHLQQNLRVTDRGSYQDRRDRYPVVEAEEIEPTDPVKKAKLRKQQQRYRRCKNSAHLQGYYQQ